jgi:hypothetical protein
VSAEHHQANLEVSCLYGLQNFGEHSLMLSHLVALKVKGVASITLNYFELECNLGMFHTLLGTMLGNHHALTTAYRAFWVLLLQGFHIKLQKIINTKCYVNPAHILQSIQLVCFTWFTQKRHHINFTHILFTITLSTMFCPI